MLAKLALTAILSVGVGWMLEVQRGFAQDAFFQGKNIRIMVTAAPGGGYDIYVRLVATHFSKHVPGNPVVLVDNVTGGGGLIAVNQLYNVSKPDGLTMVHTNGAMALHQYLGREGIQYDAPKFHWIGSAVRVTSVCLATKSSGVATINDWRKSARSIKLGGMGPGTTISDHARILAFALGLPTQLVEGYKGGSQIKLAIESGEVEGACGYGWETVEQTFGRSMELINVVIQAAPRQHPELSAVPLAVNFARSDEERRLIEVGIHDMDKLGHSWMAPPGTPPDRVRVLRRAFQDTMKDPDFLNDAKKAKLPINPTTGEEIESIVGSLAKLPPALLERFKEMMLPKRK